MFIKASVWEIAGKVCVCELVPLQASLGCGIPTAVADLHPGEAVLDLGSGAGADVFISARRVGAAGKAIEVDMTDEMLELARRNAAEAGVTNVEFLKGYLEELPVGDNSVDVVISNCVINLAADKRKVIAEVARVLRPGGRFAVSDVIGDPDMDEPTRADMEQWTGCIVGVLTEAEFRIALTRRGTHRHRGQAHPPRPPTRGLRQHPRPQALRGQVLPTASAYTCCGPAAKDDCCGSEADVTTAPSSCGCQGLNRTPSHPPDPLTEASRRLT